MADCTGTSTGLTPIMDLAGTYMGYSGRLYPGSNSVPAAHASQADTAARAVQRLDTDGNPSSSGTKVFLAIGMSNTNQEWDYWSALASDRLDDITLVNGAQGGQGASDMDSAYFDVVDSRLATESVTPEQVQWIWLKTAEPDEAGAFPSHAQTLQANIKAAVLLIASRYPNCQGISFSSRTYAGYAEDPPTSPSVEPWAYEGGFAAKWLIESQIDESDVDLAYGSVPVLLWGPYLWADGETARSDGLTYICSDFQVADGTHPDTGAKEKVADLLETYLTTSDETSIWYVGPQHVSLQVGESDNTNQASYTTSSFTPTADTLQIAFVHSRRPGADGTATPTLSGNGLTWELIESVPFGTIASERSRLSAFRALGSSPSAGGLTVDFGGQTQSVCNIQVLEIAGSDTSGTNGSGAIIQSNSTRQDAASGLTTSLDAKSQTDSISLSAFAHNSSTNMSVEATAQLVGNVASTPEAARMVTSFDPLFDTSPSATLASGTSNMAALSMEIAPAAEDGGGEDPDPPPASSGSGFIIVGTP